MKKQFAILGLAFLFNSSALFISCSKDEATDNESVAISSAEDDANADNIYDDVYNEMDESLTSLEQDKYAVSTSSLKSVSIEGSKTITVSTPDTVNFPKTITIQYTNWTDMAGRIKNGTITIVVTGRYRTEGATKTVTFQNFSIDSIMVEGTHTVKNLGRNASQYLQYEVKLVGGKLTFPGGLVITREFTRTRTWVSGESTPHFVLDDAYMIEGTATGVNRKGNTYTRTITNPLYIAAACPWIAAGTVELNSNGRTININYGDSNSLCDNKAIVTVNGISKEITIHRGKRRN
ncbi:MAG TPA: hypothetical protein VHO72_04465 [Bacteroidales bacterium]|nr:hypothetical protein [Bacteroidales bacterium]